MQCDQNGKYPAFCQEENKCKPELAACMGKCLNPERPYLYVQYDLTIQCIHDLDDCGLNGPHYLCNGICIPAFLPCNNTCSDNVFPGTYMWQPLFGPVKCNEFGSSVSSFYKWKLNTSDTVLLKDLIDFNGEVCLPGSHTCNGTCSLDPKRPKYEVHNCNVQLVIMKSIFAALFLLEAIRKRASLYWL